MNNLAYTGRLVADITVLQKPDGKATGRLTLAHDVGWGDNKETDFPTVFVGEDLLTRMQKAGVKKGSAVEITGTVRFKSKKEGDKYINSSFIIANSWNYAFSSGSGKKEEAPAKETAEAPSFDGFTPVDDEYGVF